MTLREPLSWMKRRLSRYYIDGREKELADWVTIWLVDYKGARATNVRGNVTGSSKTKQACGHHNQTHSNIDVLFSVRAELLAFLRLLLLRPRVIGFSGLYVLELLQADLIVSSNSTMRSRARLVFAMGVAKRRTVYSMQCRCRCREAVWKI